MSQKTAHLVRRLVEGLDKVDRFGEAVRVGTEAKRRGHTAFVWTGQTTMSEMATEYRRRPISIDEYERMAATGILGPAERVELIEGEIILMPPMGPLHRSSLGRLISLFALRLQGRAVVFSQVPIRIPPISEPEPDFAIHLQRDDFYLHEQPGPENAYGFVECSETSLRYDRKTKLLVYAKAGLREYWIVNLIDRCVEVHREPHEFGYRVREVKLPGETLAFELLADIGFTVDEVLGPAL